MSAGVVPDSAIDTLLMYAYAQPGVQKADLEVDRDDEGNGESPSVTYKITLTPFEKLKWDATQKAKVSISNSILKKSALLLLSTLGAPVSIESAIIKHAKEYLPAQYEVRVKIVE